MEDSSDDETWCDSDTDEETFDVNEYRKLLATLFPSKYATQLALESDSLSNIRISCVNKEKKAIVNTSSQENIIIKTRKKNAST